MPRPVNGAQDLLRALEDARLLAELQENFRQAADRYQAWGEEFREIPLVGRAILAQQLAVSQALAQWAQGLAEEFSAQTHERP